MTVASSTVEGGRGAPIGPPDHDRTEDAAPTARRRGPLALLLELLIRVYRLTGPFRQPRCRFHPSCSTYALEAVRVHGGLRGGWLATRRLLRCHPWNPGGVDHVPPRSSR